MKKLLILFFALVLAVALIGCSSDDASTEGTNESSNGESAEGTNESSEKNEVNFPTRDIEIVVGFGAGGGTDVFARAIAREMSDILGVNVNVINQEGASGVIAGQYVAQQPADGYTIWAISSFPVTTAAGLNDNGLDVMTPIARVQSDTFALQVLDGQFESIEELIDYAKENPGKLRLGGVGTVTNDIVVAELLMNDLGIDMNYIPYENPGQMHAALLGGHIDVILEEAGPTISQIEDGQFVPLIFLADERLEAFPDVPVSVELGSSITHGVERGFVIRADVDQEIIAILEDAVFKATQTDAYKELAANTYLDLRDGWLSSEDYRARLEVVIAEYAEVLAELD